MAEYFNVTTNLGDAEVANAIATNTKIEITHIAFGDGNGSVPTPSKSRTALVREVHRQAVTKYERHDTNPNWIVIETVIPSNVGGFTVREIGVIGNGKLISHGNHAPFEKVADPSGVSEYRLKFTQNITDGNVVSITLDESLIFATQAWVEENYIKRSEIVDNLTTSDGEKPLSAKMGKKLQDEKLAKSTLVDNLTTDDAEKPLSAAMGKKLQDEKVNKTDIIALNRGGTGATNAAAARTNLGLGTAATQNTGTSQGQIMTVGLFGYGGTGSGMQQFEDQAQTINQILGQWSGTAPNGATYGYGCGLNIRAYGYAAQIFFGAHSNTYGIPHYRASANSDMGRFYKFWTAQNTTVDANGFIKNASPIVQLFADKIELNDEAQQQNITFEKVGTGDYLLKNSTGLSNDGWYVEQPRDANGNLYHAVLYEQLENGDISVKTFEQKLESTRIVADVEKPVDIKENRFISIRLNELPKDTTAPHNPNVVDSEGNPTPSKFHYLENGTWKITTEDEVTLENERYAAYQASLRPLTRRQFKLALLENGLLDQIENSISAIEDDQTRARIQIEYTEATEFHRMSDSVMYMCQLLNLTGDQVDQMWTEALTL